MVELRSNEQDLTALYDLFGIGSAVRTPAVLLANVQNAKRRSDCLSAIEREFFTQPCEDEHGEEGEECLLNWAAEPAEYIKQFREALTALRVSEKNHGD